VHTIDYLRRSYAIRRRPEDCLLPVLSSIGTLLLVFVLSTTTLAHRHRPVLLPTPSKKKIQKKKNRNENETALKMRRTTRVRTKTWSTHRYYNSFIFQGLSFRISPANTLSLYSLANSASLATVPRARDCWLLKDTSKIY